MSKVRLNEEYIFVVCPNRMWQNKSHVENGWWVWVGVKSMFVTAMENLTKWTGKWYTRYIEFIKMTSDIVTMPMTPSLSRATPFIYRWYINARLACLLTNSTQLKALSVFRFLHNTRISFSITAVWRHWTLSGNGIEHVTVISIRAVSNFTYLLRFYVWCSLIILHREYCLTNIKL